ncbi:hypothetical protein JCM11491_001161 [Sporobolomyces phaffii]
MDARIVNHATLSDFLRVVAARDHDDVRLNLVVGPLVEVWSVYASGDLPSKPGEDTVSPKRDAKTRIFISVWVGTQLRLVFTKFGAGQSRIASPLPPSQVESLAIPLLDPLVRHLLTLPIFCDSSNGGPTFLRTLAGPQPLVRPFLSLWPYPSSSTPGLDIHACSIRAPSLPPVVPFPEGHSLQLFDASCVSREDLDHIAHLVIGFLSHPSSPVPLTLAQARERVTSPHSTMWVYRAPSPEFIPTSQQ